jgi:transposase
MELQEGLGAAGKFVWERLDESSGLDISKPESHGQAFISRGQPQGRALKFEHTREGLAKLLLAAQELEHKSGKRPEIILETTGHYQSPVVQFLGKIGLSIS